MAPHQARDPEPLSRPRLSRRGHLRRAGGIGILLRQVGPRPHATGSRDDRGPLQGALQIRAVDQPAGRPRPRQRRAEQHGRCRLPVGSGQIYAAQRNPGDAGRPPERLKQSGLVSRLGLQRGQGPRGVRHVRRRARPDRAPRARSQASSSHADETIESQLRQFGPSLSMPSRRRPSSCSIRVGAVRAIVGGRDYGGEPVQSGDGRACASRAPRSSRSST